MRRFIVLSAMAVICASGVAAADDARPAAPAAIEPSDMLALNPLSSLDSATLDGFRDAPLFTPSRVRPSPPPEPVAEAAAPEPEAAEAPPPEPPALKLAGIATGPDGAIAFVAKDGSDAVEQLRLGDQVDGWLVTAIDPEALKLTLEDRDQEYRLFAKPDGDEAAAGDGDEDDDKSGDDASDSSGAASEDQDDAKGETEQNAGARHEMEAARKAQRNSQRRQRLTPEQIGPE